MWFYFLISWPSPEFFFKLYDIIRSQTVPVYSPIFSIALFVCSPAHFGHPPVFKSVIHSLALTVILSSVCLLYPSASFILHITIFTMKLFLSPAFSKSLPLHSSSCSVLLSSFLFLVFCASLVPTLPLFHLFLHFDLFCRIRKVSHGENWKMSIEKDFIKKIKAESTEMQPLSKPGYQTVQHAALFLRI